MDAKQYTIADTADALEVITKSKYSFLLGGSRRMSQIAKAIGGQPEINITEATDWDFYATFTYDLHQYLLDNGFNNTDFTSKMDETGYEIDSEACFIVERAGVQVVLRKNAGFYLLVFENIPVQFYHDYLWKSSPTKPDRTMIQPIFNALFAVAHAAER